MLGAGHRGGIALDDQGWVFEPFIHVDASSTRNVEGTALGLPVSRQLARLLGSEVRMESRSGIGSTFTLLLPSRTAPA